MDFQEILTFFEEKLFFFKKKLAKNKNKTYIKSDNQRYIEIYEKFLYKENSALPFYCRAPV